MSINLNGGSEKYIEYGNEKLTLDFLKERINELDSSLKNDEACDALLTKKNLDLNNRIFKDCINSN